VFVTHMANTRFTVQSPEVSLILHPSLLLMFPLHFAPSYTHRQICVKRLHSCRFFNFGYGVGFRQTLLLVYRGRRAVSLHFQSLC